MIFVSSVVTKNNYVRPASLLYAATKGAVEQLTRVLAPDLGARGITVNAISPGATATPLFLRTYHPEAIARMAEAYPAKRIGQPEEIAPIVAFLARDEANWVNGQNIYLNNVRGYGCLCFAIVLMDTPAGRGCLGVSEWAPGRDERNILSRTQK